MARDKLITFRSGSGVPSAGDFEAGEPAVDTTNSRFYVKMGGTMVEIGPMLLTETTARTSAYTLALTDLGRVVPVDSASAITVTVPTNASVAFPTGSVVYVYNLGAGAVTLAGSAGVTLRGNSSTIAQYKEVSLRKRATNEWVVTGL